MNHPSAVALVRVAKSSLPSRIPGPVRKRGLARHRKAPVLHIKLNYAKSSVVSTDARGVIEYWGAGGD